MWRFRATGAEAADSASSRPRIGAATERVYVAARPMALPAFRVAFERGCNDIGKSELSRISGEVRPLGQQSAGRDVEHRLPVPRATSTGCRLGGKCPQRTSRPENDRPFRDLPLIQSRVKCAESAHYPKAGQVTDIVGSRIGLDMSSGACSFVRGSRCRRAIGRRAGVAQKTGLERGARPQRLKQCLADRSVALPMLLVVSPQRRTASTLSAGRSCYGAAWLRWRILLTNNPIHRTPRGA